MTKPHIPKSFEMMGRRIKVVMDPDASNERDCHGVAWHVTRCIRLEYPEKVSRDELEALFWHEMLHHALDIIGEDKLRDDERFVDALSGVLHQVDKTADWGD